MDKNLEELIEQAINKETELQVRADQLALQDKKFAEYLAAKKHADDELEVLWDMVKEHMINNNISEHENEFIKLKLTASGKYKALDVNSVDDNLCDVVKKLNNKKVKAYVELTGKLPEGVESTGYILRKTLKEQ